MSAVADTTLLSWISAEVNQALNLVRSNIAKYSAAPQDEAALGACPGHLHQVSGALRMVGLAGATRFCEVLESSFSFVKADAQALGAIDKGVLALKEFVDDLAHGKANVPLRLFPAYRALVALQGKPEASERDLFFPDLAAAAPSHPDPKALASGELVPYLQAQRSRLQRGLLGWMRGQAGGMEEIRQAVDAMHRIAAGLPEPRGVWWAGTALLEAFQSANASASDPVYAANAKSLGNKVDFYIRDLAAGTHKGSEALFREVLYLIGTTKLDSPRLREVRQLYKLDALFSQPEAAQAAVGDLDGLQPALSDLRSRLEALKGVWQQYVSGEPKTVARFRDLVASFRAKAGELPNAHLVRLLDAIALVCAKLPDPHPQKNQFMVIEMASAFLLVESVIESFASPAEDIEPQIGIMGGWLLDAAQGKSSGQPPEGLRADLNREIGAIQLRAQVAREILANLQHVEQVLDAFARDPGKRDTLGGLEPYLRQIHGALAILGMERAAEVLTICETMTAVLAAADHPQAGEDMDWIAEGLSSLGFFLDPCLHGGPPAEQAIKLFFRRYEQRGVAPEAVPPAAEPLVPDLVLDAAPQIDFGKAAAELVASVGGAAPTETAAPPAAPTEPVAEPAEPPRPAVNDELLSIYLDEAGEVLATIDAAVPECRSEPANRETLTTIRRAFHTLKGSGRMVGLMDLGEVAWEIEQVMNRWLEQQRPASRSLLELITRASAAFAGWVEKLRTASLQGEIDAQEIVEFARKLKSGEITEPPLEAAPAPHALEAPAAEPEELTIGAVRLGRAMFEIYLQEAQGHVAALQAECARWSAAPAQEPAHEFLRAAHTLASSSRTAGFTEIATLASAVEQWIPFARQATDPADAGTIAAAIARLKEMVESLAQREHPGGTQPHEHAVQALIRRLQATPPPPVDTTLPRLDLDLGAQAKAEAPAPAPSGPEQRKLHDDIDEQLLPIFLEEAQELLPQIGSDIRDWKANVSDANVIQSLQRGLHTLKGSARMAGAIRLGELTHIMESRIETAMEAGQFPPELFAELEEKMDRLSLDLERMQGMPERAAAVPAVAPAAAAAQPAAPAAAAAQAPAAAPAPRPQAPRIEAPLPAPAALLRVNADTLDHLITEAGEVSIARSRVEAELRSVKQSLGDLSESIARLRNQLREVEVQADSQMESRKSEIEERKSEYDPLEFDRYTRLQELTRLMAESLHDVVSIQQTLQKSLGETDAALTAQARTSRDVQQALMRMRAVPFSNLNERLYRIVRQSSRELNKKAELEIQGSQVELDRSVLEKIGAPLEHMLRNALAHGLESPEARVAAGKPEAGTIGITLRQESNEIALVLSDDGAGIDLEKLHRKAIERGLVGADQVLSDAEKINLIFASGVSTADAVTELAGRGVGMDVVRNEITSIGGRVDIASVRGKGTTFAVYLPLTLAVTQVVMVRAGESRLAISAAMVENVLRLKSEAMASLYDRRMIEIQERSYPLHYLQQLLGVPGATQIQAYNSVLLLRSGIQRIALHVDELIGNQEIVVKNIGPQLARVPGVAGATVMPDGSIVLIANPVQLAQRARLAAPAQEALAAAAAAPAAPEAQGAAPIVMVVDDSLTVRKITSRLLEREGYQVLTAKDGLDALQQLKDNVPAVMLVDIEMPRMDGFDLTKNVRGDPRTAGVPIVMISSRTADKHRNQAAQLGVNAFLGKPYQETELLQHIASFIGSRRKADHTVRLH